MDALRGVLAACAAGLRGNGLYRRCFPLREDVEMGGRRLQLLRLLGEGGYSFVYLVRDLNDPDHPCFALKRIWAVTREQLDAAKHEIATIGKLQHRNLLNAVDSALVTKTDPASGAFASTTLPSPYLPCYELDEPTLARCGRPVGRAG